MLLRKKTRIPNADEAFSGRDFRPFKLPTAHAVLGTPIEPPWPDGIETAIFGLGCFWGAERLFWNLEGVHSTAVGYAGGVSPNPTYEEVCSGHTGHTEVVLVAFDPDVISYAELLRIFFEEHDPTQGMRQGNDVGTQYRSAIYYTTDDQKAVAEEAMRSYGEALTDRGFPAITTELAAAGPFYYAEEYHQQYLHKVPGGYCGLKGTGVACAVPAEAHSEHL